MSSEQSGRALFHWTLKRDGVIAPDERLPWGQSIALGVQHIFAMFGATVLAPILMGFDPNTAIFFSGVGTLIFFFIVRGRVPSYLGSSFSFIAVVISAEAIAGAASPNIPVALGGIIAAGAIYAVIGIVVMLVGYRWVEVLMPPVITGAVVMVIGLNLAHVAVADLSGVASWYNNPAIGMGCCGCNSWQVTAKSKHPGGVLCGFADGSVRFIKNSVTQQNWFKMHSRDDGQVVTE